MVTRHGSTRHRCSCDLMCTPHCHFLRSMLARQQLPHWLCLPASSARPRAHLHKELAGAVGGAHQGARGHVAEANLLLTKLAPAGGGRWAVRPVRGLDSAGCGQCLQLAALVQRRAAAAQCATACCPAAAGPKALLQCRSTLCKAASAHGSFSGCGAGPLLEVKHQPQNQSNTLLN